MFRYWGSLVACVLSMVLSYQWSFAAEGLDVNDVSVLFPLDSKHKPIPYVGLDAEAKSGNLVSQEVYQQLLNYAKSSVGDISPPEGVSSIDALSDWAVMAFRYDPCAPNPVYLHKNQCMQELRLVAQPFFQLGPADSALHIIYDLGVAELETQNLILKDLMELKEKSISLMGGLQTTSGRPLGVHPLLQYALQTAKYGEVPELYKNFILKYASIKNLSQVTMMGLRNGSPIDWVFVGGDVVQGKWIPAQIPNTHLIESPFVELSRLPSVGSLSPQPVNPLPINEELSTAAVLGMKPRLVARDTELRKKMSRVVHSIDNPRLSNRNTVDCVSCHTATSLRLHPEMRLDPYVSGATASIPQRVTAFVDVRTIQFNHATWNLRSFGYLTQQPSVSLRTANESGLAAESVNHSLGLTGPGKDCSKVERAVMECFARPPQNFSPSDTYETCLQTCDP